MVTADDEQSEREQNPSFQSLLKTHRLRSLTGRAANGFSVVSESGSTYTVTLVESLDSMGSLRFRWRCSCPARGRCRHIDACEQVEHAEAAADGDIDRLEMIEHAQD